MTLPATRNMIRAVGIIGLFPASFSDTGSLFFYTFAPAVRALWVKCRAILIILSLLHCILRLLRWSTESCYKICHHDVWNRLPHTSEISMFSCTTVQNSHSNRLLRVHVYRDLIFSIICLCRLIYSLCSKYPPSSRTHTLSRARHLSTDTSMTLCCN